MKGGCRWVGHWILTRERGTIVLKEEYSTNGM